MELKELLTKTQDEIRGMALALDGAYVIGNGNVIVEGGLPFVLLAHCDTAYGTVPGKVIEERGRLYTPRGSGSGVGGDDRCGCWMLFEAAKWELSPTLLFCMDEETMRGSSVGLDAYDWSDMKCFIEVDGPGFGVFYSGSTSNTALDSFMEDTIGLHRLPTQYNDIAEICTPGNPPGVTLGAAYYDQHQKDSEWISLFGIEVQLGVVRLICGSISRLEYTVVPEKAAKKYPGGYYQGAGSGSSLYYQGSSGVGGNYGLPYGYEDDTPSVGTLQGKKQAAKASGDEDPGTPVGQAAADPPDDGRGIPGIDPYRGVGFYGYLDTESGDYYDTGWVGSKEEYAEAVREAVIGDYDLVWCSGADPEADTVAEEKPVPA